jgi:hypothetical protein
VKLAGCNGYIKPFGFVYDQDGLPGVLAREFGNMLIGSRQTAAAIDHDHCDVRFVKRPQGLLDHKFFDTHFAARDTAGVNNDIRNWA